jgi:hypothetical protein
VPTVHFRVLFVLVVFAHHRRRVVHFNVTEHPTAAWTAQQLVDAFPDEAAPAYLLRHRDSVYGQPFRHRVKGMGIEEVLMAPRISTATGRGVSPDTYHIGTATEPFGKTLKLSIIVCRPFLGCSWQFRSSD